MRTLWGGFALFAPDLRLFYSGDTGYSLDFQDIADHFRRESAPEHRREPLFDIALLPIGAYEPRWFMQQQHMNPDEAVRIHREIAARRSIGVHWGTFELTDEPLDEAPRALAAARSTAGLTSEDFDVMAIGQTRRLDPRQASSTSSTASPTATAASGATAAFGSSRGSSASAALAASAATSGATRVDDSASSAASVPGPQPSQGR